MYKPIKIHSTELDKNIQFNQTTDIPNKSTQQTKKYKITTKNLTNVSLNVLKSRSKNAKILNLGNNNVTEVQLIKYRPRRLIKLKEQGNCKIPFTEMGGNIFNSERINKSTDKKIHYTNINNIGLNTTFDKNIIDNFADNEFKSYYILKFAKISEEFKKLKNFSDLMNENIDKRIFEDYFEKLSKLFLTQNNLYIKNLEYNNNSNFNLNENISTTNFNMDIPTINFNETSKKHTRNYSVQDIPTTSKSVFFNTSNNLNISSKITKYNEPINNNNTYITTLSSFNSSNLTNFKKNMKSLFSTWSEIMTYSIKFLSHIFKDFTFYKTEYLNLKKANITNETHLNKVSKELDELKKCVNKFEISSTIYSQMHKENKINDLKKEFLSKENEYKLIIYKLEDEIRTLTILLDKNKIYYNKYLDLSKEIGINRKEKEILRIKFNKELQDNNIQFLVEKDLKDELYLKIEKLNKELNEMKEVKNEEKKLNVELQSIIKKLRIEINEKKENIIMLNEELDNYLIKYNKIKSDYSTLLKDFKLLEEKFYGMKEIKIKEIDDDKNNSQINEGKNLVLNNLNKSDSTTTPNNNSKI